MPNPPRNEALERLIQETNDILEPTEMALDAAADTRFPLVLVIGSPRGGTTLTMQWLASSGAFGYPTNLMARFSRAPAIGARIQLLLTDPRYAWGNELKDLESSPDFHSDLGKTRGSLSPNEFWFFWRRFLAGHEIRHLSNEEVAATRIEELRSELAAIESVFDKPLAMKGMMLQYNLVDFAHMLPRAFFLYIERDGVYNAQSLIEARESYHGTRERWYSAKPREFDQLQSLSVPAQVAGQVHHTSAAITHGLGQLPESRWMRVEHEKFCADPASVWGELVARFQALGFDLPQAYTGPASFSHRNQDRLPAAEMQQLREEWERVGSEPA